MADCDYDLFTIGAGSGGVRASRMSAARGARVAVAEERYLGGTCVNIGCIPKKLLVYASDYRSDFDAAAAGYGWTVGESHFDWATFIAKGWKTFETRDWRTDYRGPIAIHAAKTPHREWERYFYDRKQTDLPDEIRRALPPIGGYAYGKVVAVADLTGCIHIRPETYLMVPDLDVKMGNWHPGRYAWKLENVRPVHTPVLARGSQGLWNLEPPPDE